MIKHYLNISLKNLTKHKVYSFINLAGLTIGMTTFLLILYYVSFEMSYDKFNENYHNIYRVQTNQVTDIKKESKMAISPSAVGPTMKDDLPEVADFARIFKVVRTVVSHEDKAFRDDEIFYADPALLKIFSFPALIGDCKTALSNPNSIVITEATAKKYFGNENPIGKRLKIENKYDQHECEVTAVLKDIPENSHLKFDMLISLKTTARRLIGTVNRNIDTYWARDLYYNYILLKPGTDYRAVEAKLPAMLHQYVNNEADEFGLSLQPLDGLYLSSGLLFDLETGNKKIVWLLATFGLIILVIAWINYINLSTAKSLERAKEVGIRKAIGSNRAALMFQFLFESILLNLVAVILALGLFEATLPLFNKLVGKELTFSFFSVQYWWLPLAMFFLGIIFSGWYPALVLSSFKPTAVLQGRGRLLHSSSGQKLRKMLIIFQFAASVVLIVCTFTVYRQIKFMRTENLGMNINQLLVLRAPIVYNLNEYRESIKKLKDEMAAFQEVENTAAAYYVPGKDIRFRANFTREHESSANAVICGLNFADEDFIPTFQLELLAGRNFSNEHGTDNQSVIINETALELLGFNSAEEALNQRIKQEYNKFYYTIVGVIKNYHHTSLKSSFDPIVVTNYQRILNYYALRINTKNLPRTMSLIESKWQAMFPGSPFDYFFMDDYFNLQYKSDIQFGKVASVFAFIAIVVACLGLFGLSSLNVLQRTKEVGIRKVLGARISSILILLSKDYLKLLLIANVVAFPVAWYLCDLWLANYAFRIAFSWPLLLLPTLVVMAVALFTICFQTIRTAMGNPVEALRYE